jgi:hypothetical protein
LASAQTCAGSSTDATLAHTYSTGSIQTGSRTRAMNQNPTDQTALTSSVPMTTGRTPILRLRRR